MISQYLLGSLGSGNMLCDQISGLSLTSTSIFPLESFSHLVRMWESMGTLPLHFTEEDFEAEMELELQFQDSLLVKFFFNPGLW